jgi:hypothetical protein
MPACFVAANKPFRLKSFLFKTSLIYVERNSNVCFKLTQFS